MESFETFMTALNLKREGKMSIEKPTEAIIENVIQQEPEKAVIPITETASQPIVVEPISGYKVYRDKSETFICDMEISGANAAKSKARIIIESTEMTYMFEGTIDSKGHCEIPLKKMNFLTENEIGKIKLEVIADDMVFSPWEDTFIATNHRKVTVKVTESIDTTPKIGVRISNIR